MKFSSKRDLINGAVEALWVWSYDFKVYRPFPPQRNIERLLQYLKVDSISIEILIKQTFSPDLIEKNTIKIIEFLETYEIFRDL